MAELLMEPDMVEARDLTEYKVALIEEKYRALRNEKYLCKAGGCKNLEEDRIGTADICDCRPSLFRYLA